MKRYRLSYNKVDEITGSYSNFSVSLTYFLKLATGKTCSVARHTSTRLLSDIGEDSQKLVGSTEHPSKYHYFPYTRMRNIRELLCRVHGTGTSGRSSVNNRVSSPYSSRSRVTKKPAIYRVDLTSRGLKLFH